MQVLDHGYVELVDLMPADGNLVAAVARAARVSYAAGTKSTRSDSGLVAYMLLHGHWSPFDQVKLQFRVRCPLFVRAQWYRHWSWDYNEESARYSEVREEYYLPEHFRAQDTKNRQGSTSDLPPTANELARGLFKLHMEDGLEHYHGALDEAKIAREQARMVLPQAMYTTFLATVSLRDLAHFLRQRLDTHAQWEIRQYASAIHGILLDVDTEMVNLLERYVLGARTMSAEVSRLLRLATGGVDLTRLAQEHMITLTKREWDWVDSWSKGE